jgi:hypothetical protein
VVERETQSPAFGSIVTLERLSRDGARLEVRSVLTDERGQFSIRAATGGTYAIVVRRIGARPFRSDTITLLAGDTRRVDVQLESIKPDASNAFTLTRVTIAGATPCETADDQSVRIANLWEHASTALLAADISTRDSLVRRRVLRYERALDPATLAIQNEQVRAIDAVGGTAGGFFRSLSGDSLSRVGYWQRIGTGVAKFHGPDESALLSPAFLADHCFALARRAGSANLIGLSFEPALHRRGGDAPPEIRGTIWLDETSSELRFVEFSWVSLPAGVPAEHLGGRVDYQRLTWGPWYVNRWWLRMPEGQAQLPGTSGSRFGIVEEGGWVQADDASVQARPGTIAGTLLDGESKPLTRAIVSVARTSLRTVTDAMGRFAFDSVPSGLQVVVAEHSRYETLGVRAAEADVLLDEGAHRELALRAPSDAEIPSRLCGEESVAGHGALRMVVVDAATGELVRDLPVALAQRNARASGIGYLAEQRTDERGAALFCGAPAEELLTVTAGPAGRTVGFELALPVSGLKSRILRLHRR